MAKPTSEGVKPYLVLAMVLVSVVLIALTWANNLSEPAAGGFVRSTSAGPVVATVTALPPPTAAPPTAVPPAVPMPTPDE